MWVEWVISIGLFWTVTAMYLGGMNTRIEGRPASQLLGLIASLVLYQVVWHGLSRLLHNFMGGLGHYILPSLIATLALPIITWVGFKIVGGSVTMGGETAAH